MNLTLKRVLALLASFAALLAGIKATVIFTSGGEHPIVVTVELGGKYATPTQTLQVPAKAVSSIENAAPEQGMKDETPDAAPVAALTAAQRQQDTFAAEDQLPPTAPDAAPFQRGCKTRIVQNYSSRRGVAPRLFVLHYTVSPNRPGWSDVSAVDAWFDEARAQASSNYVIDGEGHCSYIVAESDKAWAQAAFNSVSISTEVVNTGHERTYIAPSGLAKLAEVASDAMCRWGITIRQGAVAGGLVLRNGIIDHNALGPAGGGHHDITPYKTRPVITAVKRARAKYGCKNGRPGKPRPAPHKNPPTSCMPADIRRALRAHHSSSVRSFQRNHHLAVDGIVGPRTGTALGLHGC